jgi:hypothetical protein
MLPSMARKTQQSTPVKTDTALSTFTRRYFTELGATVHIDNAAPDARLEVQLPSTLAAHFGRQQLHLTFHAAEPGSDAELVAHGSRVFDQMLALLTERSAFAVQRAPVRYTGGETLMRAIRPTNASVSRLRMQERTHYVFAFSWRITYRADDKRQEIYTIWMDDAARPLAPSGAAAETLTALEQMLADAEAVPAETNDAGETLPPRLPPLTQLVRIAEQARAYATYHADVRCVSHEAEILPRLYKTLNRLLSYYQQQIDEIQPARDPEGERRRTLEADLQRKVAEEIENHRLRVEVELIGYVALETPTAVADITLSTGRHEVNVRVEQDRYSGKLRRPTCHSCGAETTELTIDSRGHVTCERCTHLCATCNELVCSACGVAACPVCGAENCETCGHVCWACGERACAQHISACPTCGDMVCHACQSECAACGVRQCKSHLRLDCVADEQGAHALICPRCAVRCPGCQQYSAHTGVCSASGQRFCQNCLVTCGGCGRVVGPGYYQIDPTDRQPYCNTCLRECPLCHTLTHGLATCAVCEKAGCTTCVRRCAVCERTVCTEHGLVMPACGHVVCNRDLEECGVCHMLVCPRCTPTCAICGGYHCEQDTVGCVQCGQEYCRTCVSVAGLCATCASANTEGVTVEWQALMWGDHEQAQAMAPHYHWKRVRNRRYDIYLGEGAMMSMAVVVVDHQSEKHRVVAVRRLSALDRLRGLLGL